MTKQEDFNNPESNSKETPEQRKMSEELKQMAENVDSENEDGEWKEKEIKILETSDITSEGMKEAGWKKGIVKILEVGRGEKTAYLVRFDGEFKNGVDKLDLLPTPMPAQSLEEAEQKAQEVIEDVNNWGSYN